MQTLPQRQLHTRCGAIRFPAFVPVTTFGHLYPLDDLVRPYLPRLAPAVMVSLHYAKQMRPEQRPRVPLCVDSGGFALLFEGARLVSSRGLGVLKVPQEQEGKVMLETIHPSEVLEWQERHADVAFTLDFPIPPGLDAKEAKRRQKLTIANAHWALNNRRRRDLPLFACVQGWDADSARACARHYAGAGFDGVAIGGLVPRARDLPLVISIVEAVRSEIGDLPLHLFGLGKPEILKQLFAVGADSADSSSYVQLAAQGRSWSAPNIPVLNPSPMERLQLALLNLAAAGEQTLPLAIAETLFQQNISLAPCPNKQ